MKWLYDRNPWPVLLYYLSVTTLSAVFNNPYYTAALAVAAVVSFIVDGGRAKAALSFAAVFALTFIVNPVVSKKGSTPVIFIGDDPVTAEAILYGLNSAALITAVMFLFYVFTKVMDSEKLLYLTSPFSAAAAMTLSAVLRFAPLYARQAGVISDQQKALGAGGDGSIPARLRFGARVFSALSTWALENGITAADSMACRGYGTGKRSFYSFYKFKPSDTVFLVSGLCLTAACALPALFCDCRFGYYPGIKPPQMSAGLMISFSAFVLLSFLPIIFETADRIRWKYLRQKI